jgi:hypothetical protein
MRKGFTIVEVSILFVIFLIVAFLVAPLSFDDTLQAKNTSRWRNIQTEFANIIYSINTQKDAETFDFDKMFRTAMESEIKEAVIPYKIMFMNGSYPSSSYRFTDYYLTQSNAVVGYKLYGNNEDNSPIGVLMYDVNGQLGPNVWGKDVFGLNIYPDKFEPFCKNDPISVQKKECSKDGTGLCCSNYYLVGGSFN